MRNTVGWVPDLMRFTVGTGGQTVNRRTTRSDALRADRVVIGTEGQSVNRKVFFKAIRTPCAPTGLWSVPEVRP